MNSDLQAELEEAVRERDRAELKLAKVVAYCQGRASLAGQVPAIGILAIVSEETRP